MKKLFITILAGLCAVTNYAQYSPYMQELNEKYTSSLFRSDNAHMLVPMDDFTATSALNVFQYIQGKVPGLSIYYNRFQRPIVSYRFGYPAFFLDEMRVDAATLANLNMTDVAMIKVFRPPFAAAIGGGPNGAIAVYTKDGDEDGYEDGK